MTTTNRYLRTRAELVLTKAGFTFELDKPNNKHPKLLVYQHGRLLPPGIRFPLMHSVLRDHGFDYRRLGNLLFVRAAITAGKLPENTLDYPVRPE